MSAATTVLKYALPFAAVLGLGIASAAYDPRLADAAPPRCLTQVVAYEDGTWAGGQVTIDGKVNAQAWTVTGPRHQGQTWRNSSGKIVRNFAFPPTFGGQPCQSYIGYLGT